MKNLNLKATFLCYSAGIAALYVILTFVSAALGLASGAVQVRLSEALTILPLFTSAAIPGLAVGCFLANLLTGCITLDIILGTLATLIGAFGTYFLRRIKPLAFLPPVISNAVIVPYVLIHAYGIEDAYWFLSLTVGIGEIISVCVLGFLLYKALKKKSSFFKKLKN